MISFPAPALTQGADEELLIEIGATIFPGCVKRRPGENGLRILVDGEPTSPAARVDAVAKFQTTLGVLRAWRPEAGELREETRAGLGEGTVRDEEGNQWVSVGVARSYATMGGEIQALAASARNGIATSRTLPNALWLNGRMNRISADFYMIHEYAKKEFGSREAIAKTLGISSNAQSRLAQSANNLSPLLGGRHAQIEGKVVPMTQDEQREFVAQLLRSWINWYK